VVVAVGDDALAVGLGFAVGVGVALAVGDEALAVALRAVAEGVAVALGVGDTTGAAGDAI